MAEVYAAYVCNFAGAIETVKKLSKEKPAFADFLRVRMVPFRSSLDRMLIVIHVLCRFGRSQVKTDCRYSDFLLSLFKGSRNLSCCFRFDFGSRLTTMTYCCKMYMQDLLKNTPSENLERISLQIALTHLESLADCLNERKREYEQEKAAKGVLKWAKIPVPRKNSIAGDIDEVIRRVVAEEDFKELVTIITRERDGDT